MTILTYTLSIVIHPPLCYQPLRPRSTRYTRGRLEWCVYVFYLLSHCMQPKGLWQRLAAGLTESAPIFPPLNTQRSRSRPQRHERYTRATRSPPPHGRQTKEKKKSHTGERKEKKGPDPSTPTPPSPLPLPPGPTLPPLAPRPPCRPPPPPPERPGSQLREPSGPRPLSPGVGGW